MWFTVLITPLISSNFSCWSLYCLPCELTFWLLLWYLQTFHVCHCIDKKSLRISKSNQNGISHNRQYNNQQEKLDDIKVVIRTVNQMTGNTMTNKKWFTVLITPVISSNFSCLSLYCLSCDLPFWLPLWYLQIFLVGHCIACHVSYRSNYSCEIFKFFLLVIVLPVTNGNSHDRQYNDQQEKFEDIKGVISTVNHMTGNTMTNKKSLKITKG
jgi:hypothetical protein